jgi:hypothetical protein
VSLSKDLATKSVREIKGALTIKGRIVQLSAELMVHTADFEIDIPTLVFAKIAEDIKVSMSADYRSRK